jgi:hypothetical protein
MIVQECLRLIPPVWIIPRDAINDDEIGGYRIPAGSTVLLCPYLIHRHPEFWENPEAFDRSASSLRRLCVGHATRISRSVAVRGCAWAWTWRSWKRC